jgi:predicted GNAT superfamily acetyltransferase
LDQFAKADLQPLYTLRTGADGLPRPPEHFSPLNHALLLAEIPSDFLALKAADFALARDWRFFIREVFETTFAEGYLITDFIYDKASGSPRSLYVLTQGETTLEDLE